MRAALALAVALAAVPAAARPGERVRGNGEKTTEQREVSGFDRVVARGEVDVRVKVGAPHSVAATIDSNLQELVVTRVQGGQLLVDTKDHADLTWKGDGFVAVTMPELRAFTTAGSSDGLIEGGRGGDLELRTGGSGDIRWSGEAAKLDVSTSGSGDVTLSGKAQSLEARTSGSGDVRARELTVRDAEVRTSGSADVDVTLAGGMLRAWTSGSGDVSWYGDAPQVEEHESGSGEVKRKR